MKIFSEESSKTAGRGAGIVSRFFLLSAALGFLIGLFEAYLLWTTPRVIPLLVPDVGWVIWFLAPLVDMIFFGLVGLGLGLIARWTREREALVAIEAGITVTFVTLDLRWFHLQVGLQPFEFGQDVQIPLTFFAVAFLVFLLLLSAVWRRLAAFSERWLRALVKPLGWGIAAFTVAAVAGIGVFVAWPPWSGPAAPPTVAPPSGAPNIVFITLDTVRADHLSSYGYSRPTTPNIDRFAETGVLFEDAIAPSSWTLASHASMFTGLLPQQHGADWGIPLASNPWTLAEVLRSRGYETAGIVGNPLYLDTGWKIAQGFETYDDYRPSLGNNFLQTFPGHTIVQILYQNLCRYDMFGRRDAREVNTSVFSWYRHRTRRPFFLFINYFDTHEPYITSAPYEGRFGKAPESLIRKLHFVAQNEEPASAIRPGERELLEDSYDDCLAYLDGQVGKLLDFLRRSPQWKNTIVIITSDHGEEFGEDGSFNHGRNLYRGVLHVPLIIAGPGVPKDVQIRHIVATRQLFSTVLGLAGRGKARFSGTSLARFWNPAYKPTPFDDAVVSELDPVFDENEDHSMMSVTTPEYQYIQHRDGRQELYNWTADPEEQDNLAGSPQEQATLEGLHSQLVNLVTDATGPWLGPQYLLALGSVAGTSRLSFLYPNRLEPGNPQNRFRIGMAQEHVELSRASTPARPTRSQRELMQSLPYQ